ncbi:hypothetical protein ACFOG5_12740 [Pedobacter fastidiosus]|uniref:hypothetical protein n=1 Tax=Pedobacter fastidiosus TaxID=2765361 RepID=UPI0036147F8B
MGILNCQGFFLRVLIYFGIEQFYIQNIKLFVYLDSSLDSVGLVLLSGYTPTLFLMVMFMIEYL